MGWEWVAVEGEAELAGPDDALDALDTEGVRLLLRAIFTAAGGHHDDFETYDRVMAAERPHRRTRSPGTDLGQRSQLTATGVTSAKSFLVRRP